MLISAIAIGLNGCGLKEEYFPDCSKAVTDSPESYPKGSELYYLSWVEHGSFGPKGESARRLLLMDSKSEVSAAERIYKCEDRQVIKNMMALVLYDLAPARYLSTARRLLTEDDYVMITDLEGSWVKAGEEFEGEEVDFYFDWGGEAALRLIRSGHYSKQAKDVVMQLAGSYYLQNRQRAKDVLLLFDESVPLDISKQAETINESPNATQINALSKWIDDHADRFEWDQSAKRYRLLPLE